MADSNIYVGKIIIAMFWSGQNFGHHKGCMFSEVFYCTYQKGPKGDPTSKFDIPVRFYRNCCTVTECKTEQDVGQSSGVDMFPKFFGQNLHYMKLNVTE